MAMLVGVVFSGLSVLSIEDVEDAGCGHRHGVTRDPVCPRSGAGRGVGATAAAGRPGGQPQTVVR
jgi:hypothetical protein